MNGMAEKDCRDQIIDKLLADIEKQNRYLELYERWMSLKDSGGGVFTFIRDNHFEKIAIYGVGRLGRNLCMELAQNGRKAIYLIDQKKNINFEDYPVYTPQDKLPRADVIIITPIIMFDQIATMLSEKVDCPLLSLEDIIS